MGPFISLSLSASVVRSWLSTESTGLARHGNASLDHSRAKGGAAPAAPVGPSGQAACLKRAIPSVASPVTGEGAARACQVLPF